MKPILLPAVLVRVVVPVLALACPSLAQAADRHLFILSGQSNMVALDPARALLPELQKLLPGAEIKHVKFARNGQPIRKWVGTFDEIAARHDLKPLGDPGGFYDETLKLARAAIAEGKPATITFFWMQGERDARESLSAAYEESLKKLLADLRRDLDAPGMNFVIGRLSDFATDSHWEAVRAAQVKVATDDPRGAWVDTDDTNNKEDNGKTVIDLHYTADGYDLFGRRLARQAVRLIEGKKPDPAGKPE